MHIYPGQMDPHPQSSPMCTVPFYTITVLPIDKCRHTQGRETPSPALQIKPKCTDLYYTRTVWYCRMQTYPVLIDPQIKPKCTDPYYTRTVWHCRMQMYQVTMYPPPLPPMYRVLLHQDSMTLQNADVPNADLTTPANQA